MTTTISNTAPIPVLLCVSGMSPAIISETFYALAKRAKDPFIAQKIAVVTTAKGMIEIQEKLLDSKVFDAMCQQNQWPVPEWDIRAVKRNGVALDDVFNEDDFNDLADTVMNTIRDYTKKQPQPDKPKKPRRKKGDPVVVVEEDESEKQPLPDQYRIHASLAGGRKTMSYYLGQAMNIFGRPQDRLSHVLLKEGFENKVSNFYYPYQPESLVDRDNKPLSLSPCADDIVSLTEFPVISLKSNVNMARFENQTLHFSEILQAINDEQNKVIHPIQFKLGKYHKSNSREVVFGFDKAELAPENLAVLLWLAWRAHHKKAEVHLSLDSKNSALKSYYKELMTIEHYVRYGVETRVSLADFLNDEVMQDTQKIKKLLAPKISDTAMALKNVSSVYDIKPKRSYYALAAQALSEPDFRALDDFMCRILPVDVA